MNEGLVRRSGCEFRFVGGCGHGVDQVAGAPGGGGWHGFVDVVDSVGAVVSVAIEDERYFGLAGGSRSFFRGLVVGEVEEAYVEVCQGAAEALESLGDAVSGLDGEGLPPVLGIVEEATALVGPVDDFPGSPPLGKLAGEGDVAVLGVGGLGPS